MATVFMKRLNDILKRKVDINKRFSFLISQLCDDVKDFVDNEPDSELMTLEEPIDLIDDEKYAIRCDIKENRDIIVITISKKLMTYDEASPIIELIYQNGEWMGNSEIDFTESEKLELIQILESGMTEIEDSGTEEQTNEYLDTNPELYENNEEDRGYDC